MSFLAATLLTLTPFVTTLFLPHEQSSDGLLPVLLLFQFVYVANLIHVARKL